LVGEHFEITAHSWLSLLFFVDWWMMADNCDESFSDDYNKLQKALAVFSPSKLTSHHISASPLVIYSF
jgi:hypothetical protein